MTRSVYLVQVEVCLYPGCREIYGRVCRLLVCVSPGFLTFLLSGRAKVQFLSRGLILRPCLPVQGRRPHAWGHGSQADAAKVGWGQNPTYKRTRRGTQVDTVLWSGSRGTAHYNRAVMRRGDHANSSPSPAGWEGETPAFLRRPRVLTCVPSPGGAPSAQARKPGTAAGDTPGAGIVFFFPCSILSSFQELKQIYFLSFSELIGPRWEPRARQVGR